MKVPHWARNFLGRKIVPNDFDFDRIQEELRCRSICVETTCEKEWVGVIETIKAATGCSTPEEYRYYSNKIASSVLRYLTYDCDDKKIYALLSPSSYAKFMTYQEFEEQFSRKYTRINPSVEGLI